MDHWPSLSESYGKKKKVVEELDEHTEYEVITCTVCMTHKIAVSNICGHCLCRTCSKKIKWCPICRNVWVGDRNIYLG